MSRLLWLRRRRRALLRVGPLVLLAAFLPSLLYVGHWGELVGAAIGGAHSEAAAADPDHASHQAHCHYGQSTCSDQPVPVSVQLFPAVVELPKLELTAAALQDDETVLRETFVSPPTEPPRV